jgi:hypothetical protein
LAAVVARVAVSAETNFVEKGILASLSLALKSPVPGSETVVAMEAEETSEYFLKVQAFAADATTRRADDAAASHPFP